MLLSIAGGKIQTNRKDSFMDIEQKLILSQQPIIFFTEGSFLKVYNHSFYVISQLLGFKLKPIIKHIKKIDQIIIYGGFPANVIYQRYPQAKPISHGYQLKGHYDLRGYAHWYQQQSQIIQHRDEHLQQKPSMPIDNHFIVQPLMPVFNHERQSDETTLCHDRLHQPLTKQQLLFLSSWHIDKYSHNINNQFIQSLKKHFKFV